MKNNNKNKIELRIENRMYGVFYNSLAKLDKMNFN
jgi:hypothetical protein